MFESGKWERYLEVMPRFHRYSANNSLLIAMQMPTATVVASYTDWKRKFGRQVRKGERGIRILAPGFYRRKVEDEDGDLVFVTAKISEGSGSFPEEDPADRKGLERLAAAHLDHFGEGDVAVRFDIVSMMALGDSRGFLMLHRDALSAL